MENRMMKFTLIGMALLLLAACSDATPDLKSPCVGKAGSPCDRRPVNVS